MEGAPMRDRIALRVRWMEPLFFLWLGTLFGVMLGIVLMAAMSS